MKAAAGLFINSCFAPLVFNPRDNPTRSHGAHSPTQASSLTRPPGSSASAPSAMAAAVCRDTGGEDARAPANALHARPAPSPQLGAGAGPQLAAARPAYKPRQDAGVPGTREMGRVDPGRRRWGRGTKERPWMWTWVSHCGSTGARGRRGHKQAHCSSGWGGTDGTGSRGPEAFSLNSY